MRSTARRRESGSRAFLEVAQTAAIAKALHALWEYREAGRLGRGEAETVVERANAPQRELSRSSAGRL